MNFSNITKLRIIRKKSKFAGLIFTLFLGISSSFANEDLYLDLHYNGGLDFSGHLLLGEHVLKGSLNEDSNAEISLLPVTLAQPSPDGFLAFEVRLTLDGLEYPLGQVKDVPPPSKFLSTEVLQTEDYWDAVEDYNDKLDRHGSYPLKTSDGKTQSATVTRWDDLKQTIRVGSGRAFESPINIFGGRTRRARQDDFFWRLQLSLPVINTATTANHSLALTLRKRVKFYRNAPVPKIELLGGIVRLQNTDQAQALQKLHLQNALQSLAPEVRAKLRASYQLDNIFIRERETLFGFFDTGAQFKADADFKKIAIEVDYSDYSEDSITTGKWLIPGVSRIDENHYRTRTQAYDFSWHEYWSLKALMTRLTQ